jgi:hypothetical protein
MLLRSGDNGPRERDPSGSLGEPPIHHHTATEVLPDETQETLVPGSLGNPIHRDIMVDRVEELLQIKVNGIAVSFAYILFYLTDNLDAKKRSEAEAHDFDITGSHK